MLLPFALSLPQAKSTINFLFSFFYLHNFIVLVKSEGVSSVKTAPLVEPNFRITKQTAIAVTKSVRKVKYFYLNKDKFRWILLNFNLSLAENQPFRS